MTLQEIVRNGSPLFDLGLAFKSIGIDEFLTDQELFELLVRHQYGDWSEMTKAEQKQNAYSVNKKRQIISCYIVRDKRVWVLTEWDRSATTVLFPDEY